MTPEISFRQAQARDIPRLAELRWQMRMEGGEAPGDGREAFIRACAAFYERTMAPGLQTHFVAEQDGRIVATVSLHEVEMLPRPGRIEDRFGCITNNFSEPGARGRRIASALLGHVVGHAEANDLELLIVWPSERAVPFYERLGFQWENEVMELRLRDYVAIARSGDSP
ncbi:MAG TPA: GNAT family N-acetyltransferase [Allosphingosinicella sp.]|jgi:GNAT superfamily N-acetyltransferase